jgi:soluble lytic murein transglycosylase-like protein
MKNIITAALLAIASLAPASEVPESLIDALCIVESNNNPKAIGDGGRAYGILQVWEVVIVDVNRAYKTNYKHKDAFDPDKARDICRKYLAIYATEKRLGRKPTLEDYARIWNGGPNGYKNPKTDKYWAKVERVLR